LNAEVGVDLPGGRALVAWAGEGRPIWLTGPAFQQFRGTAWMQEPCRTCDLKEVDWGGCRCQAMLLAGDPAAADPVCAKSPLHDRVRAIAEAQSVSEAGAEFVQRNYRNAGSRPTV